MKKLLIFILLICFTTLFCNKIDSLKIELDKAESKDKPYILNELAYAHITISPQKSMDYALRAKRIAQKFNNQTELAAAYSYLGRANRLMSQYDEALENYNKSLRIYQELDNPKKVASGFNSIGIVYSSIEQYDKALENYRKARDIQSREEDYVEEANTLHNMGLVYRDKGKYETALSYLFKSIELDEKYNKEPDIANSYDAIAIIYFFLKKYELAMKYFQNAFEIRKEKNDHYGMSISYNNMGIMYKNQGKYEKSLQYFNKALEKKRLLKNDKGIANSLSSIGDNYIKLAQYDKALKSLHEALAINKELGMNKGRSSCLFKIGVIYETKENFKAALKYYQRAYRLAKEIDAKINMKEALGSIADLYKKIGNYKQALQANEEYITLQDSIFDTEITEKIAEMQIKYDTAQKEKKILGLEKEKEKQVIVRNFFIVLTILVLIIAGLSYYSYVSKKRENSIRKETEIKIRKINKSLEKRVQTELKKREKQQVFLMQKSKLESLGRIAAGITHEINQPLTRFSLGLDNILVRKSMGKLDDKYMERKFNDFFEDIQRMQLIIDHIRTFSRDQSSESLEKIEVIAVVKNTIRLIKTQYKNHNISLKENYEIDKAYTIGNKYQLEQVIMNILSNAKDSVEEKSEKNLQKNYQMMIEINISEQRKTITIAIKDNGLGIKDCNKEKLFDPFFTTKPAEKGTGLGLSISYGIISKMKGDIKIESELNQYARMIITLPKY